MDDEEGPGPDTEAGIGLHGLDFATVVDAVNEGIWILDRDGVTVFVNPAMVAMLGRSDSEMLGRRFGDFFHPEDFAKVTGQFERRLRGQKDVYEARLVHADGSVVHVRMHASPVIIGGELRGAVAAVTDLTDIRALIAENEAALQRAEQSDRTKSRFLSWAGHELRTPLNTIAGFAQLLQTRLPDDDTRTMAEHIVTASAHLNALVQELLDYSRAESAVLTPNLTEIELTEAVDEAIALVNSAATDHRVTIERLLEPARVIADRRHLTQVIVNVVGNAIKYGGDGSTVTVATTHVDGEARCTVTDRGPGIPAERTHSIFSPFERLENSVGVPGVGLGLSIAETLVRAMQGRIWVANSPEGGAAFTIALRQAGPTDGDSAHGDDASITPTSVSVPTTHLVVYLEDEPLNAALVEATIGLLPGHRLLVVTTVAEALALLDVETPDLFLLDLNLPDGSGLDVLGALRAHPRHARTPAVMLSADATEESTRRATELGADRFITKPFELTEFLAFVEQATSR